MDSARRLGAGRQDHDEVTDDRTQGRGGWQMKQELPGTPRAAQPNDAFN
jgi:hypothetical protein